MAPTSSIPASKLHKQCARNARQCHHNIPFGSDCIVSNSGVPAVSTNVSPAGVDPNRIGVDWLPNSLANWTGRSR